jgi:crotonobetaine/carnitine-CoA ligase
MRIGERLIPWDTLDELVVDKARRHGERVFLEIDGIALTYAALEEKTRRVAAGLARSGVRHGDRVASFMFNCAEQVLVWLGTVRLGAVWTPINGGLAGEDLAYTLRDSGTTVLVTDAENRPKVDALSRDHTERLQLFVVGEAPHDGWRAFHELLAETTDTLPKTGPGDAAVILYTGGTTGLPKGVVLPHFSFILAGIRYGEVYETKPGETHFTTLPLFHAGAIQFGVMGPLVNDMRSVIDRRFSASQYWQRVRETGANVIDPIGAMVTLLCQLPESPDDRDHAVRIAIGIVNQIPPEVPEQFKRRYRIPMVEIYGLTEAGGAMITSNRLSDYAPGSNGRPYGWTEVRIADENDVELPAGTEGHVLLRPTWPHMFMLGYHNNPGKTLQEFRNLWFHTGDLGRVDEKGNLFFLGRQAHWIRRRGENVSAYEIEAILAKCDGIVEVCVVGVASEIGEHEIKAFVIAEPGTVLEPAAIVEWCRTRMAAFKIPRFIEFVDDFPRSVTKREIERTTLKKMPNDRAWDRDKAMGRLSAQSGRSGAR